MFLSKWMTQYENCMDGKKAQAGIKEFCTLIKDKKIILYGAGVTGKQFVEMLLGWDIPPVAFVDKNHARISDINGIAVHEPVWLKTLDVSQAEYVVITAANNMMISNYIKSDYEKLGIASLTLVDGYLLHRVLQGLICIEQLHNTDSLDVFNCIACSRQNFDCDIFSKYAEKLCGYDAKKEGKGSHLFDFCGYILGQVCTLNCKHCCEQIPYVTKNKRKFVPKENVIADIKKLSEASNLLVRMEFIGGEPFLHPDLAFILDEIKKIRNIASIQIFTNGTVVPVDDLCEAMKNPRIMLSISGYRADADGRHQEKINKTKEKLDKYGIRYVFGDNKSWFDFTSFDYVASKEGKLEELFKKCFLRMCHRLHDGVLYGCPHVFSGVVTGKTPKFEGECVDIRELLPDDLPAALDKFKTLSTYEMCKYCRLPFDANEVPAGIQM